MLAIAVNWTLIIHYLIVYDMHDILLDNQNIAYGLAKANCVVSLMAIIPEQQKNIKWTEYALFCDIFDCY